MRKLLLTLAFVLTAIFAAGNTSADQVTGLTTFTSGTPAYADSINANLSEIQDSVNDNDSRLNAVEDSVNDNDSRLSAVQASYMGTLHLTLGPPAFVPFGDYDTYHSINVLWLVNGTSDDYLFFTDVQLPQGAQVNSLSAWVNDNTPEEHITVSIMRAVLNGSSYSTLGFVATTAGGASGTENLSDMTISNNIIDNSTYTYVIMVVFTGGDQGLDLQFISSQIEYSLPVP